MALLAKLAVDECQTPGKQISRIPGIQPPDDADGCLQDVHWSAALIGYFPTNSLGNLYAAQFFQQADQTWRTSCTIERGNFAPCATAPHPDPSSR